jgi:hypothetical protein
MKFDIKKHCPWSAEVGYVVGHISHAMLRPCFVRILGVADLEIDKDWDLNPMSVVGAGGYGENDD